MIKSYLKNIKMIKIQQLILCGFMLSIYNYGIASDSEKKFTTFRISEKPESNSCLNVSKLPYALPALVYITVNNGTNAYDYVRTHEKKEP